MKKNELFFAIIGCFIIALILTLELFLSSGQSFTFDGPTHIQTIAQFVLGLQDGEFPVRWGGGFARYGMPIPLISQQLTSYLGAFLYGFTHNLILSYKILYLLGAFFSNIVLYFFLRKYVRILPATAGVFLFNFAPYRIVNIYIRGALPEFFATIFVLLVLVNLYYLIEKNNKRALPFFIVCVSGLFLTHPLVAIISTPFLLGYTLVLLSMEYPKRITRLLPVVFGGVAGILISSYYLVPLVIELKYFYAGLSSSQFVVGGSLPFSRFFTETWSYFGTDVSTRAHILQGGIIEGVIFILGLVYAFYTLIFKKAVTAILLFICLGLLYILMTTQVMEWMYIRFSILGNLQHQWRMLSGYILIPPIVLAFLLSKIRANNIQLGIITIIILCISFLRFPQLYTKNMRNIQEESYFVTDDNRHSTNMNTIWMGEVRDYPYRDSKAEIFEGTGAILQADIKNAKHVYRVQADSDLKVVDYTFYFPGWNVYADGVEQVIEFQDPNYRGVITFPVPQDTTEIVVLFKNTKVRFLGNLLSLVGVGMFSLSLFVYSRHYKNLLQSKRFANFCKS